MELRRDAKPIRMRNYGRIVQDMIAYAANMEAGQERDSLEVYIAQCMRQRNLVWNRDQEAGLERVKEDILRLSDGRLTCDSAAFERVFAQNAGQNTNQKKKKK